MSNLSRSPVRRGGSLSGCTVGWCGWIRRAAGYQPTEATPGDSRGGSRKVRDRPESPGPSVCVDSVGVSRSS
jgi:hypothetical protein